MMIGAGRIYEAACTLSFDKNLHPTIDQTIIVSPYSFVTLTKEFEHFGVDVSKFKFYHDNEVIDKFNLQAWATNHWYLQQGFKLSLMDSIDSDFLIQDCDVLALQPYQYILDNDINFRVEDLWNPYQQVYADAIKKLIGFDRAINYSFVTEFMPYKKQDWIACKNQIENFTQSTWQNAITNLAPFDEKKWFSEYELLGIFKTNTDTNYKLRYDIQPIINNWEDFFRADWSNIETIKFKAQPFKYMGRKSAITIRDFFIRKDDDRII
jgi:hypothetical protein